MPATGIDAQEVADKPSPAQEGIKRIDNGVDPTDFFIQTQLTYEYLNFPGGSTQSIIKFRGDYPIGKEIDFRLDVPLVYASTSGKNAQFGLGDMRIRISGLLFRTSLAALFLGIDSFFDTATSSELGRGKFIIGPATAVAFYPLEWLTIIPLLEYRISIAGDRSRPDINHLIYKTIFEIDLPYRIWLVLEPRGRIDFEDNDRASFSLEGEGGKLITERLGIWVRYGHHVAGKKISNFSVETGIRYLFDRL